MSKARIIRLTSLEQKAPTTTAGATSPFPAIAALVDENGGLQPHESYADAFARLLGMEKRDLITSLKRTTTPH